MSSAPSLEPDPFAHLQIAHSADFGSYLAELRTYLQGIVPEAEIRRYLEETADHLETLYENRGGDGLRLAAEFGSPRELADQLIEVWYHKRSRLSPLERLFGPGHLRVVALFGLAAVAYLSLLQFRIFLPSNSAFDLPWSPGQIRRYFPEPLPFPDFSFEFLLMTGIPLLAPPILGWIVGRIVPVRPVAAIYSVLMPMILVSYIVGVLLLPVTDGLIFAVLQSVYWLPVGCLFAGLSAARLRKVRAKLAGVL